uniref:Uncharacterized protein n=1 Tax=Anguilla anguilla TaxID=7936 RepID=A0A0E9XDL8_ANGAN
MFPICQTVDIPIYPKGDRWRRD